MSTLAPAQAWTVLRHGLEHRAPVALRYHGHDRVVCPHVLGFKAGRAMVLCYQAHGTTSHGSLAPDPGHRWRSLFVDEIEDAWITAGEWATAPNYSPATAPNYSPATTPFTELVAALPVQRSPCRR